MARAVFPHPMRALIRHLSSDAGGWVCHRCDLRLGDAFV